MKSWLHLILGLLAITLTGVANAGVRASLDNDQVAPGDSVQLTLVHDGQTNDEPDLSPLGRDFDVLGRQSSTSVQVINGSASARTELTLTISPKRSGTLTVPSITWGGDRTSPLTLNVTSSAAGQSGSQGNSASTARSANVFIETEVDPKQPVVQSAVRVTVKLYIAQTLYRANLDLPASGDVIVQKVGDDEQSETVRNGRTYKVVTRHYLVFPQHSGTIQLQGPVLSAQVADRRRSSFFDDDPFASVFGQSPFAGMTSTRPMRLHGDDITLNVQPRPPGFASGYWLPAKQVTLEGEWNPTNGQTHVGDPITLTLHLRAEGQTAAQLPDLSTLLALPDGVKAYPDQAKLDNAVRGDAVVGTRSQSIALIADTPGRFSIPDLKVRWWDTRTGQPRETTLPGKTLVIEPAAGSPSTSTAANPAASQVTSGSSVNAQSTSRSESSVPAAGSAQSASPASATGSHASGTATSDAGLWRWIALGLGVMWLATLAAWLGPKWVRSKARTASAPRSESMPASGNVAQARAEFHNACRRNDALAARRALLAWVRAKSPGATLAGLNAFAKQLDDPALADRIRALDRACFTGETWQDGAALAQALADLPTPKHATPPRRERASLAPLYP